MKHYQISKYADQESDTWSAVTDIGNVYQGEKLSKEEYLRVENSYIDFIEEFLAQRTTTYKVKFLMDLRGEDDADKSLFSLDSSDIKIRGGEYLETESIVTISRLCLRDLMGIRLEADNGSYITFGNDFYLRVGFCDDCEGGLDSLAISGLFVNQMDNDPDE
jgi:hypothetical protein